jgi:hypothetical protein
LLYRITHLKYSKYKISPAENPVNEGFRTFSKRQDCAKKRSSDKSKRTSTVLDQEGIREQVIRNCNISDARYAGYYSVCGLALRLRDLYKWEKNLEPWKEEDPAVMLDWIGQKEEEWETLMEEEFRPVTIRGASYDPFDAKGINALLEPAGLFYGAGYLHSLKPSFFLAGLDEKRKVDGSTIYFLGKELARDLLIVPALSQEDDVIIRKDAARLFLWNQIFFTRKSARLALAFALGTYGLKDDDFEKLKPHFNHIASEETEVYLHHELGEIRETVFDREVWRGLVATYPHTPVELLARAVKDLLADTNKFGNLNFIAQEKRTASLGFHVAFLDGVRRELFPEIIAAFKTFTESRDWRPVQDAINAGYERGREIARKMISLYREGRERDDMDWVKREIWWKLLVPLGIVKEVPPAENQNG